MSTPRSRSSRSSRSGGGRRAAPANDNSTAIMVGVGVLVLAVVGYMALGSGGGNEVDAGEKGGKKKVAAETMAPDKPSAPAKSSGPGKAGKTPGKAAPSLTASMLAECESKLAEAKAVYNDGQRDHKAGKHDEWKAKGVEATEIINGIKDSLEDALDWQEEADMEGWAMPSEYVALSRFWDKLAKLRKKVRMVGN